MKIKLLALLTITFLAFSLISCKSTEQEDPAPTQEPAPVQTPAPQPEQKPAPKEETVSEEDLEYKRSVGKNTEVSKETFNADKATILKKIEELNTIMTKKDYNSWLKYIDSDSKTYWQDTNHLTKYSEKLPKEAKGIKLRTLQDYFNYVFIPARKGRTIDEIRYNSASSIKAVQMRKRDDGTTAIIVYYNFIKENSEWKVYLPRL